MGLTVRPYLAIINLSVATGFRTPILFGRLPTGSLYSLEKLIEWKPILEKRHAILTFSLYSLEKLIEWKQLEKLKATEQRITLYSLEKLIEWKQAGDRIRQTAILLSTR